MYSVGLLDLKVLVIISNRYSLYVLCLPTIEIAHIGSSTITNYTLLTIPWETNLLLHLTLFYNT